MRLHNKIIPENELLAGIMFGDVDGDGNLSYNEFVDLLIVGMPAPVQTSPKKARLSPSRANGTAEAVSLIKCSPGKITSTKYTGYSPSRIIASPSRNY